MECLREREKRLTASGRRDYRRGDYRTPPLLAASVMGCDPMGGC